MMEILAMPRRTNRYTRSGSTIIASLSKGLPINSLPGWENIPLNCKLPMLHCPDNAVIFSKNKIGESTHTLRRDFDLSVKDHIPEYNPLHDVNLKNFYAIERNLKRLRENGEITSENDVICTLKDFNAFRDQLHKSNLYFVLQRLTQRENEQRDRMLIANAEAITARDHENLAARQHSHDKIMLRRKRLAIRRQKKFQRLWERTEDIITHIGMKRYMEQILSERRKLLLQLNIQRHQEISNNLQRKRQIVIKKMFQTKKERFEKNMKAVTERRIQARVDREKNSWDMRLDERIAKREHLRDLMEEFINKKLTYIEEHREQYQQKWDQIQEEIKKRAIEMRTGAVRPKKKKRKKRKSKKKECCCEDYQEIFDKLLEPELCKALNAAIEMDEHRRAPPFSPDDPTYKAAHYIIKHIIGDYKKDLADDKITFRSVAERIDHFLIDAKRFVMYRATQIISAAKEGYTDNGFARLMANSSITSRVSFSGFANTIGTSSYEIHPFADVRRVSDRKPTPAGSFASVVVESQDSLIQKMKAEHLTRNDLIFIEHFIIRFKRELIVGVGRRVFAAIRCHFEDKIMDVRQELLNLDRTFLVHQITRSILSYACNPLNFEANLKLCVSAMSSEIIRALQKHLLRPKRDPRGIVRPRACTQKEGDQMKLCLYCH